MLRRSLLLAAGPFLISCGGNGESEEDISFTVLAQASAGFGELPQGTYVIRQNVDAIALANSPDFRNRAIPPDLSKLPSVDYSKFILICVSYGIRGSCDDSEIVAVKRRGQVTFVEHRKVETAGRTTACGNAWSPWTTFVTIPIVDGSISFTQIPSRILLPPA